MKIKRTQRLEVVQSDSPSDFQDKINEIFERLADEEVKYKEELFNNQNGFSAFIRYEAVTRIPECLADEYEIKGIVFHCKDCEYYTPINSYEGTCPCIKRGGPRASDEVKTCIAFWERMEEETETGKMYENLRREIKSQYRTIYKFCEKLGINYTYFSTKLNNAKFTWDDKVKVLRALGYELSEENVSKFFAEEE